MSDLATMITAIAALVASIATLVSAVYNNRSIKKVTHEVTTSNSQTMAQLVDATESRRIGEIPPKDRTTLERSHIKEARKL